MDYHVIVNQILQIKWDASKIITAYLVISLLAPGLVFAQVSELVPSTGSEDGVLVIEPATEPVLESVAPSEIAAPEAGGEDAPPPEENAMAGSQGVGDISGGSDGTPNTIKHILPDVDRITGALVFEYPLKTPPGRNGIEPNLALIYNSLSNDVDSIFGYGWESNIPYIRRVNKKGVNKLYTENYFESSFSGELVAVSGSSTAFTARVENGDFLKYTFANSTWTATDKLGKIYTFGNTSSTQQASTTSIYAWMLAEVRDLNGNYMTYEYYRDQGQIYPSKIYYTQHSTSTTPFEIEFTREARSDVISKFDPGFEVKTAYRIKDILAKYNSTSTSKYTLSYTTSTSNVRTVLDTIIEIGLDGGTVTLPATNFDYQGSWGAFVTDGDISCPSSTLDTTKGVIVTDVNGDGLPDFVESKDSASSTTYINNGNSTWTPNSTFNSPLLFWSNGTSTKDFGVRMADVNGDGRTDLLKSMHSTSTTYLNASSGWSLATGSNWTIPEDFVDSSGNDINVRIVDVNGDGLPDIIRKYLDSSHHTSVYLNNGSGWTSDSGWSFPIDNLKDGIIFADLNNDGLMDMLQSYRSSGSTWTREAYFNRGDKSWNTVTGMDGFIPGIEFNHIGNDYGVREADVNGDGYSDLIQAMLNVGQNIYLNTGTGFSTSTAGAPNWYFVDNSSIDTGARMADYTGDGMVDALDCSTGGQSDGFWKNASIKADLLNRIKSSLGGFTNITYTQTTKFKNGSTLLNAELPYILDTVVTLARGGDGISPTSTQTFSYQGGKQYFADSYDRKMAGFSKVISTDSASNTTTLFFHQGDTSSSTIGEYSDHFSKIGKVYRTEVSDSAGNIFSKIITKWDQDTQGSSSFVSAIDILSMMYDGDGDHKDKAETYTYSTSTGNVTQKIERGEVSGSDDGTFTDTGSDARTTALTYASNATDYVLALPASVSVTNASGTKVKEDRYYYDSGSLGTVDNGNLTKQEKWKSGSTYIDIEKTYNSFGLVTQEKDPSDKATNFIYDTWNLYPATSTNALSQSTGYIYDYPSGQVAQRIDANGSTFQSLFDGLGRLIEEKQQDLNSTSTTLVTKTTLSYTDAYGGTSILRTNYLDSSTSSLAYTYFDGFGRTIQTRTEAEDSNLFVAADTVYNNLERISKESLPYFSSGTSRTTATSTSVMFNQYTYDSMLRITAAASAVGTIASAYDDWKTTITDARGKIKHLYDDAYGNLNRVDEVNASSTYTTTYAYDLNNNLTNLTDALGNVRNFTYDGLSRRLTAQDLHASGDGTFGTWTYSYDDSSNLTQTVDPNSQTVNYTYDDLNRVLTENYTGSSGTEQSYAYDFCLLGIGKLCEASSTASVVTQYRYNSLGGIARETKTVSSSAYQTDYTYDRQGNVVLITNPDGSEVKHIYNTAGQLEAVLWKESD